MACFCASIRALLSTISVLCSGVLCGALLSSPAPAQQPVYHALTKQVQFAACLDKISGAQRALSSALEKSELLSVLNQSTVQG